MQLIIIIISYISMTSYAYAYIDPGAGSVIIQAILGFLAAIFAYVTFFWNKIKSMFNKIFKKNEKKPEDKKSAEKK